MDLRYEHPTLLLQHMVWHEGYHHGQMKQALTVTGRPITDEEAGPVTWDVGCTRSGHGAVITSARVGSWETATDQCRSPGHSAREFCFSPSPPVMSRYHSRVRDADAGVKRIHGTSHCLHKARVVEDATQTKIPARRFPNVVLKEGVLCQHQVFNQLT
jgi:hypothetical protein